MGDLPRRALGPSAGDPLKLLLRRHSRRADPLLKVVERAMAERPLPGQRLVRPTQPLAVLVEWQCAVERWEQAKIDVHRLVGARTGVDRLHVATSNVI